MYPVTPPSAPANKASLGFILPVVIPCTSKFAAPALIAPAKKSLVVKDAPRPALPNAIPPGPNNIVAPIVSAILPMSDLATDLTALATLLTALPIPLTIFPTKYPCLGYNPAIPPPAIS